MIFRKKGGDNVSGGASEDATRKHTSGDERLDPKIPRPDKTELTAFVAHRGRPPERPPANAHGDPQTRLHAPKDPQAERGKPWDPVVGWLVVVDGPGRGSSFALGFGMNHIGRVAGQKICLNFGDEHISRVSHASLTFDPVSRRFFLAHGGGRNLTYVGGSPVLSPTELVGGEIIVIGKTKLTFVPFCGPDFSWQAD